MSSKEEILGKLAQAKFFIVPPWAGAAGEILNRNRNRMFVYLRGPRPTLSKEEIKGTLAQAKIFIVPPWAAAASEIRNRNRNRMFVYLWRGGRFFKIGS